MNVRNTDALLNATGEFSFSPGATTVATAQATGYYDFGNIVAIGFRPSLDTIEHEGSYRGVRSVDKSAVTKASLTYTIKCDEWDREKLKYAIFGDETTAFTQSVLSASAHDGFAFNTTAAVLHRWYDIKVSGVRVRELTAFTLTGKTENTDYVVDYKLGRVRFLTAQSAALSGTVSAPAVTSSSTAYMLGTTPMQTFTRSGFGRLVLFDDAHPNNVYYDHFDFACDIDVDSADELDGKKFGELTINVVVSAETPGTVFSVE